MLSARRKTSLIGRVRTFEAGVRIGVCTNGGFGFVGASPCSRMCDVAMQAFGRWGSLPPRLAALAVKRFASKGSLPQRQGYSYSDTSEMALMRAWVI